MNRNRNPIGTATIALLATSLIVGLAAPASGQGAQRKGAMASIRVGEVVAQERVDLKDNSAAKGALVGGAIGLALGSGKSGKDRRKRTAIGAYVGAIAGSAKKKPTGMKYSVGLVDGTIVQIVTDQTQIRVGDCVSVEESGSRRRPLRSRICRGFSIRAASCGYRRSGHPCPPRRPQSGASS